MWQPNKHRSRTQIQIRPRKESSRSCSEGYTIKTALPQFTISMDHDKSDIFQQVCLIKKTIKTFNYPRKRGANI